MECDLVVEGKAVTPLGTRELELGILDGRISAIKRQGLRGARRIAAPSCLIFPGFIDTHVHLREPGWEYKEDFATGTAAAVHGGVTTVFDMPNNPVPATSAVALEAKVRLAAARANVDVRFFGGVDGRLSEIRRIRCMVVGYKLYLAETTGNLLLPRSKLRGALEAIARTRKPASVHCEEQTIIDRRREELTGQQRPDLHADLRPPEAEIESVRALLSRRGRGRVNICHVSTSSALRLIEDSRRRSPGLACEVTLHHLFFSRHDMLRNDLLRVNPPLRGEEDRVGMLQGLSSGSVDFLVTDHAPHTLDEKRTKEACGVPGLDNYGNVVSWLIKKQGLSPESVAEFCSGNQAMFFGLRDRGTIEIGKRADLTLLDLKAAERAGSSVVRSKCGWTPYEGFEFPGRVRWTLFGGKPLLEDFQMVI